MKSIFTIGTTYTRQQIRQGVGGGSIQTYLPTLKGQVLCACLNGPMNLVPGVICVGNRPRTVKAAEILCQQDNDIPVFVKEAPSRWVYHGRYKVKSWNNDLETLNHYRVKTRRSELTKIIFMEKVSD